MLSIHQNNLASRITQKVFLSVAVLSFVIIDINSKPAHSIASLDAQVAALGMILDSADRICTRVEVEGSRTQFEISGAAEAELSSLIQNIIGLGIDGSARFATEEYSGPLRSDLATIILSTDECRLNVFDRLAVIFLEARTDPEIRDDRIVTAALPPQSEAQYKSEYLSAVAMSAAQDNTGEWMTVSVLLENISDAHVYLAVARGSSAFDDRGNVYNFYNISGIRDMSTASPSDIGSFSEFAPGSRHTILAVFRGKRTEDRARIVSFSSNLWFRTSDSEVRQLPFGLSNIALLR